MCKSGESKRALLSQVLTGPLEDCSYSLATADTHGLQTPLGITSFHLVKESGKYASASSCDGMT